MLLVFSLVTHTHGNHRHKLFVFVCPSFGDYIPQDYTVLYIFIHSFIGTAARSNRMQRGREVCVWYQPHLTSTLS